MKKGSPVTLAGPLSLVSQARKSPRLRQLETLTLNAFACPKPEGTGHALIVIQRLVATPILEAVCLPSSDA